jgi:molybdopterin-binding protein
MTSSAEFDGFVRIGTVAKALGVSVDTLRRWERDGRITFERRGSQRVLAADQLADLMRERNPGDQSSARNRFEGVVIAVVRDKVMAKVDMICGENRIVSLMSREAADELGLEPGVPVAAVVKATTVVVERQR